MKSFRFLIPLLLICTIAFGAERIYPNRVLDSDDTSLANKYSLASYPSSQYTNSTYAAGDRRNIGNVIEMLAIKYWIDSSASTLALLQEWVDLAVADTEWDDTRYDLEVSHLLLGLSIMYDWHRDNMIDSGDVTRLKEFIHTWAAGQYDASKNVDYFWAHQPFQNHHVINHTGMLAAGLALLADYTGNATTKAIRFTTMVNGPFESGETITGVTSGATGTMLKQVSSDEASLIYTSVSGTFQSGETITGAADGSTARVTSSSTVKDIGNPVDWIAWAEDKIIEAYDMQKLITDGTFHEMHGYGDYNMVWMVRGLELLKQYDPGTYSTIFNSVSFFQNYYKFFEALTVDEDRVQYVDLNDAERYKWYNPSEYFMRFYQLYANAEDLNLARYYQDSYSRLKPDLMQAVYTDGTGEGAGSTPALRDSDYFDDIGLFAEKDITSGSVNTAFWFISAIPGGWGQYNKVNDATITTSQWNISHWHPCANSFIIWDAEAAGYLIEDTGGGTEPSGGLSENYTKRHNGLTIASVGQIGEYSSSSFDQIHEIYPYVGTFDQLTDGLRVGDVDEQTDYTKVRADAAAFYPTASNLSNWIRTIVWMKPGSFYVFDYIVISSGTPALKMWFNSQFNFILDFPYTYRLQYSSNPYVGTFQILYPTSPTVTIESNTFSVKGQTPTTVMGQHIGISNTPSSTKAYYVTVVDTDASTSGATLSETGSALEVEHGSYTMSMSKTTGAVTVSVGGGPAPSSEGQITGMALNGVGTN